MERDARADIDVVIPTAGRASLWRLLTALGGHRQSLGRVVVVDDRGGGAELAELPDWVTVVRDELLTLLTDGPTSTSLAWTFERLLRNPEQLERARADALDGDGT